MYITFALLLLHSLSILVANFNIYLHVTYLSCIIMYVSIYPHCKITYLSMSVAKLYIFLSMSVAKKLCIYPRIYLFVCVICMQ